MSKLDDAISFFNRIREGASHEFGLGREDHRQALQRARAERGKDIEATRIQQMMGTNRTITMGRELAGIAREEDVQARENMGIGLSDDKATRIGQVLGTLGSDIVQDRGRELWWLINAPQALGNIAMDVGLKKFAPDLFASDQLRVLDGKLVPEDTPDSKPVKNIETAVAVGAASADGKPKAGYSFSSEGYKKRRHQPGFVHALDIPAGIAINSGIGLLTPFGLGTTAAGMLGGNIIEQERRRRNQEENERDQMNRIDTIN